MDMITINKKYPLLTKPLTREQIVGQLDDCGDVKATVAVELSEIIDNDIEGLMDILEERMLSTGILSNISYEAIGVSDDGYNIHINVCAQVELFD